jgi:hypothetical protein
MGVCCVCVCVCVCMWVLLQLRPIVVVVFSHYLWHRVLIHLQELQLTGISIIGAQKKAILQNPDKLFQTSEAIPEIHY